MTNLEKKTKAELINLISELDAGLAEEIEETKFLNKQVEELEAELKAAQDELQKSKVEAVKAFSDGQLTTLQKIRACTVKKKFITGKKLIKILEEIVKE